MIYLNFKHYKYVIVVGLFMIINGCNFIKNGQHLVKLYKTPVNIKYPLKRYDLENKWTDYKYNNKYKVINYIDVTCGKCLETLISWKRFMQKYRAWNVDYLFYIKPIDIELLAEFLKEIEFNYPIIIDEGNEFCKNNIGLIKNENAKIIWLVNAENKIIISGDPINNNRILKAYESIFQK
jgi:hypothetical protein